MSDTELIGVFQGIIQDCMKGLKLTDVAMGTVVSDTPLKVQLKQSMPPIPESALLLTDFVKERVAPVQGGEGGTVTISERLKAGERVLLLRVSGGNRYIVLSRA